MAIDTIDYALADQERMEITNPRLKKLYNYFSEVGKNVYSDHFLLSNAVFSKSDLPLSSLGNYLGGQEPKRVSFLFSLRKIIRYFLKNFGWLFVFLMQHLAYKFSRQKFVFDFTKPLTLIDIFFKPEQIAKNGDLNDRYFPGLEAKLKAKAISYAYVPRFFGAEFPMHYYNMFRQLKEKKKPVLSTFQLLGFCDYLKMFTFIFIYPVRVLRQTGKLEESREGKFLRCLIWEAMDQTAVKNFSRQLFGRNISKLSFSEIKCISWYENHPQDKNFYIGLRTIPEKVKIFGAQLYIWPTNVLNLHVDKNEISFRVIPDRILVNGSYYLRNESTLDFKVGPSMRYARLFQTHVDARNKTTLLVLMPFFEHEINEILKMINEAKLSEKIFIKFHPSTNISKYTQQLEGVMQVTEDDIYTLFDRVGCVIGQSTGALVEATSLGIPVINVTIRNGISYDYLPEFGKGVIWQNASSGDEIIKWVTFFRNLLKDKPDLISSIAKKYKGMFFCEPTDKRINEAFELEVLTN